MGKGSRVLDTPQPTELNLGSKDKHPKNDSTTPKERASKMKEDGKKLEKEGEKVRNIFHSKPKTPKLDSLASEAKEKTLQPGDLPLEKLE